MPHKTLQRFDLLLKSEKTLRVKCVGSDILEIIYLAVHSFVKNKMWKQPRVFSNKCPTFLQFIVHYTLCTKIIPKAERAEEVNVFPNRKLCQIWKYRNRSVITKHSITLELQSYSLNITAKIYKIVFKSLKSWRFFFKQLLINTFFKFSNIK